MTRVQLARLLLIASILYVIGFYFVGAAIKPGYSQLSSFVSEYNAAGTPWAGVLTYAGFLATTLLLSAFLFAGAPLLPVSGAGRMGKWLLWCVPASYFIAVIAPCDAGCPLEGSFSQILHNAFAVIVYFGIGASLALLSFAPGFRTAPLRRSFLFLSGIAFPPVFFAMVQPELEPWGGLLQRSLDMALAVSLLFLMWTSPGPGQQAKVRSR
jgi:hypothetical protein